MKLGLQDRVAVITGAASGIGAASARLLAEQGVRIVGCDIDGDALHSVISGLPGHDRHLAHVCDIGSAKEGRDMIAAAMQHYGRIDILANVAAILHRTEFMSVDEAEYDRTMDVNLKSQFFLCQAVLPHMQAARWGRIINFTSPAAFMGGLTGATHYSLSKAGAIPLSRSLARQFGPDNICVNVISPGSVDTPIFRTGLDERQLQAAVARIPLGRLATPEEIATGVVYLSSEWARYVSGHVLSIDGGATMRP